MSVEFEINDDGIPEIDDSEKQKLIDELPAEAKTNKGQKFVEEWVLKNVKVEDKVYSFTYETCADAGEPESSGNVWVWILVCSLSGAALIGIACCIKRRGGCKK